MSLCPSEKRRRTMVRSDDYPPPVVLDTTVLSCFASTDDIHRLTDLPIRFVTVEAVSDQLHAGVERGHDFLASAVEAVDMISVEGTPGPTLDDLDHGEAHALYAAWERNRTIVTDDGPARDRATELGVPVTGSIGLLLRLVRQETLTADEADAILHRWMSAFQYRSPVETIHDILDDQ